MNKVRIINMLLAIINIGGFKVVFNNNDGHFHLITLNELALSGYEIVCNSCNDIEKLFKEKKGELLKWI